MALESCPLCQRFYSQLSQHLRVLHGVTNIEERKLLLALQSGRVNVREGICPIPGCGIDTKRIDRHLRTHTELTDKDMQKAISQSKRKKIIAELAKLRASNPTIPMVSTLDLQEQETEVEDPSAVVEEKACDNEICQLEKEKLKREVADLNQQVDTLTTALRKMTRQCRVLKRRQSTPSVTGTITKVTRKLLSALGPDDSGEASETVTPSPPSNQPLLLTEPEEAEPEETALPHFPDHVAALNELMEEYRGHQEGPDPSSKLRENVGAKIYRIKNFISFMAVGKTNLSSLVFLNETAKIRAWLNSLKLANMKDTTINHYLKNVAQFMDYVKDTPPPTCRLSKQVLIGLQRELRALLRSLKRGVVMHQISVKQAKEARVIPKSVLRLCRSKAKEAIPEILDSLEETHAQRVQYIFYGHLTAYLSSIYGHRFGVFQNLTIKEVEEAKKTSKGDAYLINICSHKTNQAFGAAQISLEKEEYQWFQRFLGLRTKLVGGENANYFFFTSTPNPCKNLNKHFQQAWKTMKLPGCPTFTDVRTSIATHAKNTHSQEDRAKIAQFMCHDTSTADKFYAMDLSAKEALHHRRLFELALEGPDQSPVKKEEGEQGRKRRSSGEEAKSSKRPRQETKDSSSSSSLTSGSTTPEKENVVYQESGTSASETSEDSGEKSEEPEAETAKASISGHQPHVQSTQTKCSRVPIVMMSPLKGSPSSLHRRFGPHQISPLKFKKAVISRAHTLLGMATVRRSRQQVRKTLKFSGLKKAK